MFYRLKYLIKDETIIIYCLDSNLNPLQMYVSRVWKKRTEEKNRNNKVEYFRPDNILSIYTSIHVQKQTKQEDGVNNKTITLIDRPN
jgi:hypothetical protein